MATRTECECDLDYWCGNHTDCALCGQDMPGVDQSAGPKLCGLCKRTAKAWARSENNARRFPDPEGR